MKQVTICLKDYKITIHDENAEPNEKDGVIQTETLEDFKKVKAALEAQPETYKIAYIR